MTGVYEHALGNAAGDLHPKVLERYGIGPDDEQVCVGRGRMNITRGTHVLPVLYAMTYDDLLFPEAGRNVPFAVRTIGHRLDAGHEALTTSRIFEFASKTRRFDSLTVWDSERERLLDFLGRNGLIATELHPRVESRALVIDAGDQWLRRGDRYIPLPGPLAASTEVRDRYDETDERFHVTAVVESTLTGHILSYRGSFTQEFHRDVDVPEDLLPTFDLGTLPPA